MPVPVAVVYVFAIVGSVGAAIAFKEVRIVASLVLRPTTFALGLETISAI